MERIPCSDTCKGFSPDTLDPQGMEEQGVRKRDSGEGERGTGGGGGRKGVEEERKREEQNRKKEEAGGGNGRKERIGTEDMEEGGGWRR